MQKLSARTNLLERAQVAAFMTDAGESKASELLGDIRQTVAISSHGLIGGIGHSPADVVELVTSTIGDAAVEITARILVVGAAGHARRVLRYSCHAQRLAVVKGRVTAAMMNGNGQFARYLIEVVHIECTFVFQLGIVEEIAFNPGVRRRGSGFGA